MEHCSPSRPLCLCYTDLYIIYGSLQIWAALDYSSHNHYSITQVSCSHLLHYFCSQAAQLHRICKKYGQRGSEATSILFLNVTFILYSVSCCRVLWLFSARIWHSQRSFYRNQQWQLYINIYFLLLFFFWVFFFPFVLFSFLVVFVGGGGGDGGGFFACLFGLVFWVFLGRGMFF